jgi:hypothetical protein
MLREELQLLQEPGSYVGEVVKVMSKTKVLVKARSRLRVAFCVLRRVARVACARVGAAACCASAPRAPRRHTAAAPRPPAAPRTPHTPHTHMHAHTHTLVP